MGAMRSLFDRTRLKEHECSFHARTDFQCCGCNRSFNASEDLRRHSRKTSHAIPRIFYLEGHSLEESVASCGEMVNEDWSLPDVLSCSQSYRAAQSAPMGAFIGPVVV